MHAKPKKTGCEMADLSKMGEVMELTSWGGHSSVELVNKHLNEGWQILTVKIVEKQFRMQEGGGKDHIHKTGEMYYVLGKPRGVKKR